jgi:hypothetical protein
MTGKIVNLRQARKRRDRAAKVENADANAARHGQSKHERTLRHRKAEKSDRDLDGHKRED